MISSSVAASERRAGAAGASSRPHATPVLVRNSFVHGGACLEPLRSSSGTLTWYACGPTVYDDAHLGHARTYVCQDIIRRVLEDVFGVDVDFVMGITDIDDKIIARAATHGRSAAAVAAEYERRFMEDMAALGVRRPEALLRVSEHIPAIVAYIGRIMARGLAYAADDGVYFDTRAFGDSYGQCFGALSGVDDGQPESVAITGEGGGDGGSSVGAGKRDKRDFALWKAAKAGEPSWESPWGTGRPGWHIECSAMTDAVFGGQLDLHSGGIDLAFPHHTNEVAQCEACYGVPGAVASLVEGDTGGDDGRQVYRSSWVGAFIHTGHVYISGRKMSKSLKNFITVRELLQRNSADEFRVFCLQHQYNRNVTYNEDRLRDAAAFLSRVREFVTTIDAHVSKLRDVDARSTNGGRTPEAALPLEMREAASVQEADRALRDALHRTKARVRDALATDFDTPTCVVALTELVREGYKALEAGARSDVLQTASGYVAGTLRVLGVQDVGTSVVGEAKATRDDAAVTVQDVADQLFLFREDVRLAAAKGDTAAVLAACDHVRDNVAPSLGLRIRDVSSKPGSAAAVTGAGAGGGGGGGGGAGAGSAPGGGDDAAAAARRKAQSEAHKQQMQERARLAQVPPDQLFRGDTHLYSQFDEEGVPTHDESGVELSKSARKKLAKKVKKQAALYAKHAAD